MTQFNLRTTFAHSRINGTVTSLLMAATVILAGFVSMAVFAA